MFFFVQWMFHIVSFTFEESEVSEITSETVVRVKLNISAFLKAGI